MLENSRRKGAYFSLQKWKFWRGVQSYLKFPVWWGYEFFLKAQNKKRRCAYIVILHFQAEFCGFWNDVDLVDGYILLFVMCFFLGGNSRGEE